MSESYRKIVSHYESRLAEHGDSLLAVDWPNERDAETRYRVMLDVIRRPTSDEQCSLLDFGCGASHMYEYMLKRALANVTYSGLDLSEDFIDLCRTKFPSVTYYCVDILKNPSDVPEFDYVVMNGVFTEKRDLAFDEMFDYMTRLLKVVFEKTRVGIAFNVFSKQVDFERDVLFHVPFDRLASLLCAELTRDFVFRNDYGLYEYTTYVYK